MQGLDPVKQNLLWQPLMPAKSSLWACLFRANRVVPWCGLKSAIGCVCSRAPWEGLQCKPKSDTACDWPWVTP